MCSGSYSSHCKATSTVNRAALIYGFTFELMRAALEEKRRVESVSSVKRRY